MKNFLQSLSIVSSILTLLIFTIGCNAENPICTTNFCAIGEVFPRSELDTANFSEVDIDDSVIFATLVGVPTPVETIPPDPIQTAPNTPVDSVALSDIVRNVANGGKKYIGETVTITAPVDFAFETFFTLYTNNDTVNFFVRSPDNPNKLTRFKEGLTYTLTVEITEISPPNETRDWYSIRSNIDRNAPIDNQSPMNVTVNQVVSNVASGGTRYLGKTIKVTATVKFSNADLAGTGLALATNNTNVSWAVIYTHDKTTLNAFRKKQSYTFTLFVHKIDPPDPLKQRDYYSVFCIFVSGR